ncbi:MAG: hypothetical protein JW808_08810, partial [Victivallales bacterium]|nr:hypothetical protein [Victivallales bacterium]
MRRVLTSHYSDRGSRLRSAVVYGLPLIAGLVVRVLYFIDWHRSAFRFFHVLSGLDMKTLLGSGDDFYHGRAVFSAYSFFLACIRLFCGIEGLPTAVVVVQMLLGLGSIVLTVFVARKIFGSDVVGISAGLLLGVYAPLVIFESHILKASFYMFVSLCSL